MAFAPRSEYRNLSLGNDTSQGVDLLIEWLIHTSSCENVVIEPPRRARTRDNSSRAAAGAPNPDCRRGYRAAPGSDRRSRAGLRKPRGAAAPGSRGAADA